MEREFEIWSEGYWESGMELGAQKAQLEGKIKAKIFQEACDKFFKNNDDYNSKKLKLWGCRLYDNEKDARKSFG